jgi:hypothetical protein
MDGCAFLQKTIEHKHGFEFAWHLPRQTDEMSSSSFVSPSSIQYQSRMAMGNNSSAQHPQTSDDGKMVLMVW